MDRCKRGHEKVPENRMPHADGGTQCRLCKAITNRPAVDRYQATARGQLTRIRSRAKDRVAA